MRTVIQRVKEASVSVKEGEREKLVGKIGRGITLFLGIGEDDTIADLNWMVDKVINSEDFS